MTTAAHTPAPVYTVAGTGPYTITHAYSDADHIAVQVYKTGVATVTLTVDADYTVSPDGSDAQGTVTLTSAAATLYNGYSLSILRATPALQSYAGVTSQREVQLEVQLDSLTRAMQDIVQDQGRFIRVDRAITELSGTNEGALLIGPNGQPYIGSEEWLDAFRSDRVGFSNVAAMVAFAELKIGDRVRTVGYHTSGDRGANAYEVVAAGTGTADGGLYIDLTGSSLQAKGLFPDGHMRPEQFGARGDATDPRVIQANDIAIFSEGTDDATAVQAALDASYVTRLPIALSSFYRIGATLTYQDVIEAHRQEWGADWAPSIIGTGEATSGFVFSASTGNFLEPESGIAASPRGQRKGGTFSNFRIQGPGNLGAEQHGLCIDNMRTVTLRNLRVDGFPTGAGIRLTGRSQGGTYGADLHHIQIGDRVRSDDLPSPIAPMDVRTNGQFWLTTCRWGILLEGPATSNGKLNDFNLTQFYTKGVLEAGLKTRPIPGYTGSDYVSANGKVADFHIYSSGLKIEYQVPVVSATANTVTIAARTPVDASGLYDGDVHTGYRFKAFMEDGAAINDLRTITDDVVAGSQRTLTVDANWTATPSAGDLLTIEFGNDAITTEYGIADYPTGVSLKNAKNWHIGRGQLEELRTPIIVWDELGLQTLTVGSINSRAFSRGIVYKQSEDLCLASLRGQEPLGMDNFPAHAVQIGDILHGPRDFSTTKLDEQYGILHPALNDSGGALERGDVCQFKTSNALLLTKTFGNSVPGPVVIDHARQGQYADGSVAWYRALGITECKVTGTVNRGDLLVPAASGRAETYTGFDRTDPTTWPHPNETVGEARTENASGDGVIFIRVQPRS